LARTLANRVTGFVTRTVARFSLADKIANDEFARHQFPPAIVRHEVWLNARFTLSFRDVEDLLAERGLESPTKRCNDGF